MLVCKKMVKVIRTGHRKDATIASISFFVGGAGRTFLEQEGQAACESCAE